LRENLSVPAGSFEVRLYTPLILTSDAVSLVPVPIPMTMTMTITAHRSFLVVSPRRRRVLSCPSFGSEPPRHVIKYPSAD
jgi:hypothetical protein